MNPFPEVERLPKEQGTHEAPQWRLQQVSLSTGGHQARRAEGLQCNSQWRNEREMTTNVTSSHQNMKPYIENYNSMLKLSDTVSAAIRK